jgi:hypothetical protein
MLNNKEIQISLSLNFLVLANYFLYYFNAFNTNIIKIFLILLIFLILIFYIFKPINNNLISKIFIFFILIFSLGIPLNDWDGKYIWMFHAKRIFYEKNLFIQLDNYLPYTHNDYPALVSSLSASIASFFNLWNNQIPKLSSALMLCPTIIFLNSVIKDNVVKVIFFTLFIWVVEKTFLSGSVDDILASYTLCSFVITYLLFFNEKYAKKKIIFFLAFTFITITTLIKNEGTVIIITLFTTSFILKKIIQKKNINLKIYLTYLFSLLPIIFWKIECFKSGISSDIININLINNLQSRIEDLRNFWNIFNYMILNKSILLPLLLFFCTNCYIVKFISKKNSFFIFKSKSLQIEYLLFCSIFTFIYLLILFFVYLSTPNDLVWHLSTSAYRVVMPIGLILIFYFITVIDRINLSR